jgi:hypothetical protein
MSPHSDGGRELLRHTVATLAYRGGKAIRGAPADFAAFSIGPSSRTPLQILAHVGDLFDWAVALARGQHAWHPAAPISWEAEAERFFAGLQRFDEILAGSEPLAFTPEQLFQGPVADALTHIGQLAMLRRLAGTPVRGENYFKAEIRAGRVGADQSPPRVEFD